MPNRHGDRYPLDAAPYSDVLPPRVQAGRRNPPMTGYVVVDGKSYGKITATTRDPWTEEVAGRLRRLDLPGYVERLSNHVEMKVVTMMVRTGARTAEVVINNVPCGYGPGRRGGCHDVLPAFLPHGHSLTVLGTDTHGRPFRHTYHGKANQ